MSKYAVVIPLTGAPLESCLSAWEMLAEKFKIRRISSSSHGPHITLIAGTCRKPKDISATLKSHGGDLSAFRMQANGLGIFVRETPIIYVRWLRSKALLHTYKTVHDRLRPLWREEADSTTNERWTPKTTLAGFDATYDVLANVIDELKKIDFSSKMTTSMLYVLKYDSDGEDIIDQIDLQSIDQRLRA